MKKGSKISVTSSAKYSGQEMSWSETFTGQKIIGKGGEWVTHTSPSMMKEMRTKMICVHTNSHSESYFASTCKKEELTGYSWKTYLYSIYLPEGFVVDTYSDDEYRFELTEDMTVIFSGEIIEAKAGRKLNPTTGRYCDHYVKFSDTKRPY